MKPNSLLYNYRALVISVNAPDSITALVDHGFRSWAMRQFRLTGVESLSPRQSPKDKRDVVKANLVAHKIILEKVLKPDSKTGMNILMSPEKPAFSGLFHASIFLPFRGRFSEPYCIKYAGLELFDVCAFMRDVCSGRISQEVAISFIGDVNPKSFIR